MLKATLAGNCAWGSSSATFLLPWSSSKRIKKTVMSQNVISCWLLDEMHRAFLPTVVKIHSFLQQTADVREPRCSGFRPFTITRFLPIFDHSWLVPTNRDETAWLLPLSWSVRLCFSLSKVYVFCAPWLRCTITVLHYYF